MWPFWIPSLTSAISAARFWASPRATATRLSRSAEGSLSWLAYLITFAVALVFIALALLRVKKATLNKEPK